MVVSGEGCQGREGVLSIMAYTGRLHPKGIPSQASGI